MTRDPRAFMTIQRVADPERDPAERVGDYGEIFGVLPNDELREFACAEGLAKVK